MSEGTIFKCPDCGEEVKEVEVERHQTKTFKIDYENKRLMPVYPNQDWEQDAGDFSIRCQHCGTLNLPDELYDYLPSSEHLHGN